MVLISKMGRFKITERRGRVSQFSQSLTVLIGNECWSVLMLLLCNTEPVPLGLTL